MRRHIVSLISRWHNCDQMNTVVLRSNWPSVNSRSYLPLLSSTLRCKVKSELKFLLLCTIVLDESKYLSTVIIFDSRWANLMLAPGATFADDDGDDQDSSELLITSDWLIGNYRMMIRNDFCSWCIVWCAYTGMVSGQMTERCRWTINVHRSQVWPGRRKWFGTECVGCPLLLFGSQFQRQ